MNSINVGNQGDEAELEDELEALQQEQLDEQMLGTGSVPVSDAIQRLPAAANGESKRDLDTGSVKSLVKDQSHADNVFTVKGKTAVEEDDEEAELRKLQAEMAM